MTMNSFPLVKTKSSNEKIMAVAFLAAVLYLLPGSIQDPGSILNFLAVLAAGLAIDTVANFIRYKRPVCAVSAAVTVSVLYALSPGVTLWEQLLAVTEALIAGKHIWGGTGRNPVNPAILGLLFLDVVFHVNVPAFAPSVLLLPAVLVSLPFILIRPFAAAGMIAGLTLSLLLHQSFSLANVLSYGVIFWGCLVITDPVTVTAKPLPGALFGFLAGFVPLYLGGSAAVMAAGVLLANILSFAADALLGGLGLRSHIRFKKKTRILYSHDTPFYDMTDVNYTSGTVFKGLNKEDILDSIKQNRVFGLGGAAFPTYKKIQAAIDANADEYHLIVNGVECDPGLIHDKWLLHHQADKIVQGIKLLQQCIPFSTVTVAAKNAEGLSFPEGIAVRRVPDYYPAGAEKLLIREVLKKTLPQDSVPANEGILVLNIQTVAAVYEAVCLDKEADTKLITIADLRNMSGCVARVCIGANVHDTVKKVFSEAACVFTGGGMMNARIAADETVIDENVNFIAVGAFPNYNRESFLCSRCGYCSAICPAGLKVNEIARLVDDDKIDRTARLHPERCMACGSCSHVCLAGRNLAARVTAAKGSVITVVSDNTDTAMAQGM
jgi:Na+-translocating ferredoxin:NAD+ oxidoreductase RnfD subunit/ferredoxin